MESSGEIDVVKAPAQTSRRRTSLGRVAGRSIWVAANLALGHFVLFNAYFMSVLAFHDEDFDQSVTFGLIASVIVMGVAVAIIATANIVLRLLNRDMNRRMFWWVSSATCLIGAAANFLVHPYLL